MPSFRLLGLPADLFSPWFALSDADLAARGARRIVADASPGYPCRVSLCDAEVGDRLLLLPHVHHDVASPYRASGPLYVREGALERVLEPGEVPPYVSTRLISVRGYDAAATMVAADVCRGSAAADALDALFADPRIAYVHLHNASRGCYSCLAERA